MARHRLRAGAKAGPSKGDIDRDPLRWRREQWTSLAAWHGPTGAGDREPWAFGTKLQRNLQENLQVLGHALGEHRTGLLASFALFATAPLPSAQMFEAAGHARVRLRPLLAAFFLARLVSYSIYVSAASTAHDSLSRLFDKGLFSPEAIATQIIGIAVLIAIVLIDWPAIIDKARGWWATRRGQPAPPSIRKSALPPVTPGDPKT